jgi:hypothetical protein
MRHLLLIVAIVTLSAGEPAMHAGHAVRVTVTIASEPGSSAAAVVARFVPDVLPTPHHLYPLDVPANALGQGVATSVVVDQPLVATGPATADVQPVMKDGTRILPAGPVTVRLPVRLPVGDGTPVTAVVRVGYMACTDDGFCKMPVRDARIVLSVPTAPHATGPASASSPGQTGEPVRHMSP